MPIEGLSDARRLPRLGKIRLGVKAISPKSNKEYPKAVDYFVCPEEVQAIYGEKPKEIDIIFPVETWPEQWYKAYSASRGLICKGDGKVATALIDQKTGEFATTASVDTAMTDVACDKDTCPVYAKGQCHRVMMLQFILPKVKTLGVYQLNTGSINSIININSSLDLIKGITGRFSMIPMKLSVVPQEVQVEGKKKTVHVLQLTVERSFDELVLLPSLPRSSVLLPRSDAEAPDDLYPEGLIEEEGGEAPPALSERPGPRTRKPRAAKSTAVVAPPVEQEPQEAEWAVEEEPVEAPAPDPKPTGHNTAPGSITAEQQTALDAMIDDRQIKSAVQGVVEDMRKTDASWKGIGKVEELSDYQAAVVLHVMEGGDPNDIEAAR